MRLGVGLGVKVEPLDVLLLYLAVRVLGIHLKNAID